MTDMGEHAILVVDNDPLVRLGTVAMLRDIGYHPDSAAGPVVALSMMESGESPEILITDYSMPDMTGVEFARIVQVKNPNTRVLVMTGHDRLEEELGDDWGLLAKPFTSGELREALEALEKVGG